MNGAIDALGRVINEAQKPCVSALPRPSSQTRLGAGTLAVSYVDESLMTGSSKTNVKAP
jgi:hypothetical protein